jgi:thymidylate synthase (FAD)
MARPITTLFQPTVILLAEMSLVPQGLDDLVEWVGDYRPECLPGESPAGMDLFPHGGARDDGGVLTGNELLVELAGRNCYMSYGAKAGKKSNADYIAHTQSGSVPHRSIMYHAKMTFFIAGISRRVSHELIRHYVGADRSEEGSPSMESTRYTHHPGHFVVPPKMAEDGRAVERFKASMSSAYTAYHDYIEREVEAYRAASGEEPKGLSRKRIYEAAAGLLPMQAATSLVWTANPVSLAKMFAERTDESSDAEFRRLALQWQKLCAARWPNLFPSL